MQSNYVIEQICKKYKISDYLSERGINPSKSMGSKHLYNCPLPSHSNDDTPSFTVFDKGDREDYFCFGCRSSGSIINFISEYEGIGLRQTIERLSEGIGLKVSDILDSVLFKLKEMQETEYKDASKEAQVLSFTLSAQIHDYLKAVDFYKDDLLIADHLFQYIDKLVESENVEKLKDMMDESKAECIDPQINKRVKLFNSRKEKEAIDMITASESELNSDYFTPEIVRKNDGDRR